MPFRAAQPLKPSRWAWFSPWMIVGSVCILAGILFVLAIKNIHREKEFMVRALLSQANVLMRSLEASSRTGMMGRGWGNRQLQLLMEETAQQEDVLSVALVSSTGQIVAHSDPSRVGTMLSLNFPERGETRHRFLNEGRKSFEVIRAYQPWLRKRGGGGWEAWCSHNRYEPDRGLFIMVGLDPEPFEEAQRQDMNQTILLFGVMFLVGAAGFLSLVWAHHYRTATCSLEEIQAFTSTIVNEMPIGLITTDLEGKIEKSNKAAGLVLREPNGVAGNIRDLPCFIPIAHRLKKEETVVEQEIRCRLSEGQTIPLLVNAAVIRDAERRKAGHVFLFADISNIKQLEEQLRRSERLASLGRLAAGVAHEIRNPLSSIKGFATILSGRFKGDDRNTKIADVMVQEVERLNRVVSELLDFARPTELNRQIVSCTELIQNSLRLIESDARHQGVRIGSEVHPEDLEMEVDPDRFTQVLLNLYLNALHAMPDGGTLKVTATEGAGEVAVRVSDSGTGISPEHLPHIFDPYFTTKPRGVGLGLANVHKFVEAHNGEIELESAPGEGTAFTIRLVSVGKGRHESASSAVEKNGDHEEREGRPAVATHGG